MASSNRVCCVGYWDIRGLGAPIRHLLNYLNVPFEDKRYTDPNDWFGKDKFSPELALPFPNLPYFIDGDVKLTQTLAILRYIGSKYNLDGANEKEKIAISLVEQQVHDMNSAMVRISYDPACEKLKEDLLKGLPANLKLLSNFLGENAFVAGANVSYVDFWLYEYLKKVSVMVPGALDATPNLGKFISRIENHPNLANYFKFAKPQTFNGPMAVWNATA